MGLWVEDGLEFFKGLDYIGFSARPAPFFEAHLLEWPRLLAGGFEFDLVVLSAPQGIQVGVSGGFKRGAMPFAELEGGVMLLNLFKISFNLPQQ